MDQNQGLKSIRRDTFRIEKVDFDEQGGAFQARALLTRCGVFEYAMPNGSMLRELRHPDDVFDKYALDSLKGVPVVIGHPATIDGENWKVFAVGHIGDDVRAEGSFVAATIRVSDANAAELVREGALVELSCGYSCFVTDVRGTYDEIPYDARQVAIRYNHVGMGPDGWGRAGPNVRIYQDSSGNPVDTGLSADGSYIPVMDQTTKKKEEVVSPKADGMQGEQTPPALETVSKADHDALRGELAAANAKLVTLEKADATRLDAKDVSKLVRERVELERVADTCGVEARIDQSDSDLRKEILTKIAPEIKLDGESEDFVRAAFQVAVKKHDSQRTNSEMANMLEGQNGNAPKKIGSKLDEAVANSSKRDDFKNPRDQRFHTLNGKA